MDFLKKHARFIIVVLVLAVVLWLANDELGGISSTLDQKRSAGKALLDKNYRALFADAAKYDGDPATAEGRKIQDQTQVIEAIGDARVQRMQFETHPDYTIAALPQGSGTDDMVAYYRKKKLELRRELGYQRYFKPDISEEGSFGFKEAKGGSYTQAQVTDYLRKLDLVRTVAMSVQSTGVQRLNKLNFTSVEDQLHQRGVPTRPVQAAEPAFMVGEGLVVEVEATEEALYNFLMDLQRPAKGESRNRYLAVETFELQKDDLLEAKDALIEAKITVVAYRVNPDSSYPLDKEAANAAQQQIRGPRTFR